MANQGKQPGSNGRKANRIKNKAAKTRNKDRRGDSGAAPPPATPPPRVRRDPNTGQVI